VRDTIVVTNGPGVDEAALDAATKALGGAFTVRKFFAAPEDDAKK
jgi:hypothetical protein